MAAGTSWGEGSVSIDTVEARKIIASSFASGTSHGTDRWFDTTRYDIVGKGPDPTVANPEVWEMMRSLLAERFKLKYHIENKEMPIYALTIAKGGPKLKDAQTGRCAEAVKAAKTCGDIEYPRFGVGIYNMPIGALIGALGPKLQDRPIVDKTGLTGNYDTEITWMPDGMEAGRVEGIPKEMRPEDISLFQALEKQAGLKLEAQKAPIPVVVVDNIEKPSGKLSATSRFSST